MYNFLLLILALLVAIFAPVFARVQPGTQHRECNDATCRVYIDVETQGGVDVITADPQTLRLRTKPRAIRFYLIADGYTFATPPPGGIVFKNNPYAARQFSLAAGLRRPSLLVMNDMNTRQKRNTYQYSINIVGPNGQTLSLDPVIINGGGGGYEN